MRPATPLLTPLRAWLLALLLLAAQATGLAHRIAHATSAGGAKAQAVWQADHKAASAECRLFDQLVQADVLCSGEPASALLLPPANTGVALAADAVRARPAPQHLARGPPLG